DPELGEATRAVTAMETWPKASHTIPNLCRLTIDRRLVPGESPDEAVADIAACARDLPFEIEVEKGKINLPNKVSPEAPVSKMAMAAAQNVGFPPHTTHTTAALDVGYLTAPGADAILFGPGDPALAHTEDELVPWPQVEQAFWLYRELAYLPVAGHQA